MENEKEKELKTLLKMKVYEYKMLGNTLSEAMLKNAPTADYLKTSLSGTMSEIEKIKAELEKIEEGKKNCMENASKSIYDKVKKMNSCKKTDNSEKKSLYDSISANSSCPSNIGAKGKEKTVGIEPMKDMMDNVS